MEQKLNIVGTAMSFVPLDQSKVPKTPGLPLPKIGVAGLRDRFSTPTTDGQSTPAYLRMACFVSGVFGGDPLGKGTLSVTTAGPERVPGDVVANRLLVEVVDIGSFDETDIDVPGVIVGSTELWPAAPDGTEVQIPVDLTGVEVKSILVLRLRSEVQAPLEGQQSDWHFIVRSASLVVEIAEEVDEAGRIAALLGVERSVVVAIMTLLENPR